MSNPESIVDLKQERIEFLVKHNASIYAQHSLLELEKSDRDRSLQLVQKEKYSMSERSAKLASVTDSLLLSESERSSELKSLEVSIFRFHNYMNS